MLWAFVVIGLVGVITLVVGWRGRRIDDLPYCRRCGYCLGGHDATIESCPECGRSVGRPRCIRVGHRVRRKSWIAVGALIFTIGAAGFGLLRAQQSSIDVERLKPDWWIAFEARAGRPAALNETIRRLEAGELGPRAAGSIVQRALVHQADLARPWDHRWGTIVEGAWHTGLVGDAVIGEYLQQALTIPVDIRAADRAASGGWFELRSGLDRPRLAGLSVFERCTVVEDVWIGDVRSAFAIETRHDLDRLHHSVNASREPGMYALRAAGTRYLLGRGGSTLSAIRAIPWSPPASFRQRVDGPIKSSLGARTFERTRSIEVLPYDSVVPIELVDDVTLEAAVRESISVCAVAEQLHIALEIEITNPPVDLSFTVSPSPHITPTYVSCRRGESARFVMRHRSPISNGAIDVTLYPSTSEALAWSGSPRLWNRRIEIPGVRIESDRGAITASQRRATAKPALPQRGTKPTPSDALMMAPLASLDADDAEHLGLLVRQSFLDADGKPATDTPIRVQHRLLIHAGERVPIWIKLPVMAADSRRLAVRFTPVSFTVDGEEWANDLPTRQYPWASTRRSNRTATPTLYRVIADEPGTHEIGVRYRVDVLPIDVRLSIRPSQRSSAPIPESIVSWVIEATSEVRVVATDTPVLRPVRDDRTEHALEESTAEIDVRRSGRDQTLTANWTVRLPSVKHVLSYIVLARTSESETPLGTLVVHPPSSTRRFGGNTGVTWPVHLGEVDVVLRPDPGPAQRPGRASTYLDADIIIEDVPVRWWID